MQVKVRLLRTNPETITLNVSSGDSMALVKARCYEYWGIPVVRQRLSFRGRDLAEWECCGDFAWETLYLQTKAGMMEIFVGEQSFYVLLGDTLWEVVQMIQERTDIPWHEQCLGLLDMVTEANDAAPAGGGRGGA